MCCFACRGVICGSGGILWSALLRHRPEKLPWGSRETDPRCCALKIQLDRAVRAAWEAGATTFACGLARGCDFYFAEAVLRLQEQAEGISLEAWIPCPEQPNRWKEPDQARYRTLLTRCSRVHVVEPAYAPAACCAGTGPCCRRRTGSSAFMMAVAAGPVQQWPMPTGWACRWKQSGCNQPGISNPWTTPLAEVSVMSAPMTWSL